MNAIIVAGGRGSRMGCSGPKCLLDIGGETVIGRTLRLFDELGVEETTLVLGCEHVPFDFPGPVVIDHEMCGVQNALLLAPRYSDFIFTTGDLWIESFKPLASARDGRITVLTVPPNVRWMKQLDLDGGVRSFGGAMRVRTNSFWDCVKSAAHRGAKNPPAMLDDADAGLIEAVDGCGEVVNLNTPTDYNNLLGRHVPPKGEHMEALERFSNKAKEFEGVKFGQLELNDFIAISKKTGVDITQKLMGGGNPAEMFGAVVIREILFRSLKANYPDVTLEEVGKMSLSGKILAPVLSFALSGQMEEEGGSGNAETPSEEYTGT